jgi:hypothetical protein
MVEAQISRNFCNCFSQIIRAELRRQATWWTENVERRMNCVWGFVLGLGRIRERTIISENVSLYSIQVVHMLTQDGWRCCWIRRDSWDMGSFTSAMTLFTSFTRWHMQTAVHRLHDFPSPQANRFFEQTWPHLKRSADSEIIKHKYTRNKPTCESWLSIANATNFHVFTAGPAPPRLTGHVIAMYI